MKSLTKDHEVWLPAQKSFVHYPTKTVHFCKVSLFSSENISHDLKNFEFFMIISNCICITIHNAKFQKRGYKLLFIIPKLYVIQGPQSQTVNFDLQFMRWRIMIFCIFRPFSETLVKHNFDETICNRTYRLCVSKFLEQTYFSFH